MAKSPVTFMMVWTSLLNTTVADDASSCQVGLYPNGVLTDIDGLFGGRPGQRARAWVEHADGPIEDLGVGGLVQFCSAAPRAHLRLAGGAGYGDPHLRSYRAVQRDLDQGFVSREAAERDYGCIVGTDGRIDEAASDRRRGNI